MKTDLILPKPWQREITSNYTVSYWNAQYPSVSYWNISNSISYWNDKNIFHIETPRLLIFKSKPHNVENRETGKCCILPMSRNFLSVISPISRRFLCCPVSRHFWKPSVTSGGRCWNEQAQMFCYLTFYLTPHLLRLHDEISVLAANF